MTSAADSIVLAASKDRYIDGPRGTETVSSTSGSSAPLMTTTVDPFAGETLSQSNARRSAAH